MDKTDFANTGAQSHVHNIGSLAGDGGSSRIGPEARDCPGRSTSASGHRGTQSGPEAVGLGRFNVVIIVAINVVKPTDVIASQPSPKTAQQQESITGDTTGNGGVNKAREGQWVHWFGRGKTGCIPVADGAVSPKLPIDVSAVIPRVRIEI